MTYQKVQLELPRFSQPFKVFISHSSKDESIVLWLAAQVRATGNEAWVAEWDPQPGQYLTAKVKTALLDCDAYIILLTEEGYDSRYVTQETGAAAITGKLVIALVEHSLADQPMGIISDIEQIRFDRNDLASSTAAITAGLMDLAKRRGVAPTGALVMAPTQPTLFSMSIEMSAQFQVTPNQVLIGVCALMLIGGLIYVANSEDGGT